MIEQKFVITTDRPVLDQLLNAWKMNYSDFARQLGINYETLRQYRKGKRDLRLSTQQIKEIDRLLRQIELNWEDLPDDWILETSNLSVSHE